MLKLTKNDIIQSIASSKENFESLLKQIQNEKDFDTKINLAYQAIRLANNSSTTYYSSDIIEKVFTDLAQKNKINLSSDFEKNSVLHIMTAAYKTGGHTRVVERWIDLFLPNEKHSVALLKQKEELPIHLTASVRKTNGKIIKLDMASSDLEKALQLREIASHYERVILHTHMDDVIPLIAFGTNDFTRPVFLFNHADHCFWLGVSVADQIVNFRSWGKILSKKYRGNTDNFVLTLPTDLKNIQNKDIQQLKKNLKIPENKKIILTVGSAQKYAPLLNLDFIDLIKRVLQVRDDVIFIAIGQTTKSLPAWKKLPYHKVWILGRKSPEEMFDYLRCADLVLDSFPMSGGTALLDAVSLKKPVLTLESVVGQLDYLSRSVAYCKTPEELLKKIDLILDDPSERAKNIQQVFAKMSSENDANHWNKQIKNLYSSVKAHQIYNFFSVPKKYPDIADFSLYMHSLHLKIKIHIPYLLSLYSYKENGKKCKKLVWFH